MSKTFLKILAEEMPIWPRSAISIWQQMDGVVFYEDSTGRVWELGLYSTADGGFGELVTRAKWEAERARIAANQQATKEAREIARTGSMTSEERELAGIACGKRSKEDKEKIKEVTSSVSVGYKLERDYEAEESKQYDQELWDRVAISAIDSILQKEYVRGVEYKLIASECFEFADMFMAERAKRMK